MFGIKIQIVFFYINLQMFCTVVLYLLFGMVIWLSVANLSRVFFPDLFIIYDTHEIFLHVYLFRETSEKLSGFPDIY